MTSSVASRPGFLRWLVTAGDPATLVATFSTAAGSPVNLSGSTVAAACANWSTSHAGSATVGGASNNEVTVAFTDTITGQLTGGGWTWTLTVDGVTTLAGPLDVAQPGVAGVTGGDASAVVVVDDVNVAVTVVGGGGGGAVDSVNGQTGVVVLGAADVSADPAGTAAGLVDDLSGVTAPATARSNLGLGNVDNTSDANKPVSTAQQTALDGKAAASHSHAGTDITSGTVGTARLGSGSASSSTFLRGDQTWATPSGIADPGGSNDDFLQRKSGAWAARTIDQVKSDLGVSSPPLFVTAAINEYVGMPSPNVASQGIANYVLGAAGRGNISPIWLPAATYDRIGVYVPTGGTATLRLGLYTADATTGLPGTKVFDAGTISAASTGLIEATISQTLSTGWYWAAVVTDAYTSTFELLGFGDASAPTLFGSVSATSAPFRQRVALASSSWTTGGLTTSPPTLFWQAAGVKVVLRRSA